MNEFNELIQAIQSIDQIPDSDLQDEETIKLLTESLEANFSEAMISQAVNQIITNLNNENATKEDANDAIESMKQMLNEAIYGEKTYIPEKKRIVDFAIAKVFEIFDTVIEKYHTYSIVLPMTVDKDAQVPTYAHDTDAAADLYAMEDQIIPPHSYGNKIRTGVKIQLPEGWLAFILPRSSIGAKTPLRLSNSVGLIDSGYRGELGILYDNISGGSYSIKAGDRIAQLLIMPSDRFKANVVDILTDSDRNEGGFGSTGA